MKTSKASCWDAHRDLAIMILPKKLVLSISHYPIYILWIILPIWSSHPKVCSIEYFPLFIVKNLFTEHSLHMILEIGFLDSNYEAPSMPQGFVYQIIIFSTWGDSYYVGLNGIQIYDNYGNEIMLTTDSMFKSLSITRLLQINNWIKTSSLKNKVANNQNIIYNCDFLPYRCLLIAT